MLKSSMTSQRLLALFAVGVALLNFPLLALWKHEVQVLGVPLFPLGLFLVWVILIVLLALIMETGED
ncbi:MAG: hypothetical protein KJ914_18255 [Gammaproteobacteria bacterium]|nr:hypothetical protein [Gammaproteobacteria bacterium]MBU1725903.1 hypothetical protein [Gammaproteobacteria bacterium]MBU2006391.1 hypothetical protein [Gammaproteobacteria bacterium]